jgi:hypothetical protein
MDWVSWVVKNPKRRRANYQACLQKMFPTKEFTVLIDYSDGLKKNAISLEGKNLPLQDILETSQGLGNQSDFSKNIDRFFAIVLEKIQTGHVIGKTRIICSASGDMYEEDVW